MSDVAAILMRDVNQNLSVFLAESLDPVRRETEVHELHNADLTRRGRAVGILFGATHDALAGDFDEHGVLDIPRTVQPVVAPHFVVNLETSRLSLVLDLAHQRVVGSGLALAAFVDHQHLLDSMLHPFITLELKDTKRPDFHAVGLFGAGDLFLGHITEAFKI